MKLETSFLQTRTFQLEPFNSLEHEASLPANLRKTRFNKFVLCRF